MKNQLLKRIGISFVLFPFLCSCASQPGEARRDETPKQRIQFTDYPDFKLGIITQNFIRALPLSVENVKTLIDYADREGFHWIELRDSDADLTPVQCREIAAYALDKKIDVAYTNQRALLDPDFWDVFQIGIENALVFDGPGTIRALASGQKFENPEKLGYTAEEMHALVETANRAARMAREQGLQLLVENWREPLSGEGEAYSGLAEFFDRVDPSVGWEFDTANFFSGSRVPATPERVEAFLRSNAHRIGYVHVKTAKEGSPQPVTGDNPLDYGIIFPILAEHGVSYLALELPSAETLEQAYANHRKSLEYLQSRGYVSLP